VICRGAVCALALLLPCASDAFADGWELSGLGAHAVGRAGAGVVSSGGGAALYYNPAGLARHDRLRLELGLGVAQHSVLFERHGKDPAAPLPTVHDLGGAELFPSLALASPVGRRVVVGLAYLTPTAVSHAFPAPPASGDAPSFEAAQRAYPERYAGTRSRLTRRGVGVGVAIRALPWLAVGGAFLGLDVVLEQDRTLWAGLSRDGLEPTPEDPRYDLAFSAQGRDHFVPSASVGIVIAPLSAPIELGASVSVTGEAQLEGGASLDDSLGTNAAGRPEVSSEIATDASTAASLPSSVTARGGVRYLWQRAAVELDVEWRRASHQPSGWRLEGVTVTPDGGAAVSVPEVPLAILALRDTLSLRAALDVDVVPGFFLLTAGYAYTQRSITRPSLSTTLPDLAGHTMALGAEARLEGAVIALGVSRTELVEESVRDDESRIRVVNPLGTGDLAIGGGRYDGSATQVELSVELEF
jgi:long-subunit fatty acid transport protein